MANPDGFVQAMEVRTDCTYLCLAYSVGWSVHSNEPKLTIASILQPLNVVRRRRGVAISRRASRSQSVVVATGVHAISTIIVS